MKVKVWVIRCLCGLSWAIGDDTEHVVICTCGVKLVRDGKKCYAEVDTDKYDVAAQPYQKPAIYQESFELAVVG
jgi:hypothetical protein